VIQLGFKVILLTSRPDATKEVTIKALERYGIAYHELIFAKNKSELIREYNEIYTNFPIIALIDDGIGYLENLPTGVVGIAWEQPWNDGYYPRARYNPESMKLEICDTVSSNWKEMWRNE
jgi:hypothetical protein